MALIGILCAVLLLSAALWGVRVGIAIVLGYRHPTLWVRAMVALVMGAALIWLLHGLCDGDARRILILLDVGLIIAIGNGIAKVTHWIDLQTGLKPLRQPVQSRPRRSAAHAWSE